jgi:hypothetical protein
MPLGDALQETSRLIDISHGGHEKNPSRDSVLQVRKCLYGRRLVRSAEWANGWITLVRTKIWIGVHFSEQLSA